MQGGEARRGLTRRQVLIGGATVGAAAALGVATTGSPFKGGTETVTFWHLFGGGDGERLTEILASIDAEHADSDVRQLILQWGNPYYTKLALAAVGGSPPDVADRARHADPVLRPGRPARGAHARDARAARARVATGSWRSPGRAASRTGASTRSRSTRTRSSSTTTPS